MSRPKSEGNGRERRSRFEDRQRERQRDGFQVQDGFDDASCDLSANTRTRLAATQGGKVHTKFRPQPLGVSRTENGAVSASVHEQP